MRTATRHSPNGRYGTLIEIAGSLRLDVRELDHLAPLLGFVGDELAEVSGRADKRSASEVGEPGLDFGIGDASVNCLVELVNNLRCVLGRADAEPPAMSSRTVVAGSDGLTSMTSGTRAMPATGTMSRMKLKLSFS